VTVSWTQKKTKAWADTATIRKIGSGQRFQREAHRDGHHDHRADDGRGVAESGQQVREVVEWLVPMVGQPGG
jgi:hypothetical protein